MRRRPLLHRVRQASDDLHRPRLGLMANRDVLEERGVTRLAALAARVDPDPLNDFAEQRAGTGPVRNLRHRDFKTETLEELADARNYILWYRRQQRLSGRPDPDREASLDMALSHVVIAYQLVNDPRPLAERIRDAA